MSFLFLQTNKKGTSEGQKVRISCVNFCIQVLKGSTSAIAIAEVIDHPVKDGPLRFRQNETALPSDARYNEWSREFLIHSLSEQNRVNQ